MVGVQTVQTQQLRATYRSWLLAPAASREVASLEELADAHGVDPANLRALRHDPSFLVELTLARSSYKPKGAALRLFFHRKTPEVVLYGGAGTGKTRAILQFANECAELYPRMRGLICRESRAALTQTALVTMQDWVLNSNQGVRFHGQRQEYQYPNGSIIAIGGLDDDATKIMSGQYDLIHVVECTGIPEPTWDRLSTRLRNNRMPFQQLIGDCNPNRHSWIWRRAKAGKLALYKSFHSDNPSVTAAYKAILGNLSGATARSLRDGEWGYAKGSVQLIPSVHDLPEGNDE